MAGSAGALREVASEGPRGSEKWWGMQDGWRRRRRAGGLGAERHLRPFFFFSFSNRRENEREQQ
jgi:hypothetical protein